MNSSPIVSNESDRIAHEALNNLQRRRRYDDQVAVLERMKDQFARDFLRRNHHHRVEHLDQAIAAGFKAMNEGHGIDVAERCAVAEMERLLCAG